MTDVRGEVEIPADPQRIVDLSGNSDILSILGYSVVGTANSDAYDYTKFPAYLEDTLQGAEILGYSMQDTMDIEAVMNLAPDLIIISTVQYHITDHQHSRKKNNQCGNLYYPFFHYLSPFCSARSIPNVG